ncbi:zinc finger CCCH domain-containing protein 31-like [Amaranthus tricolor]|uniref:zinc finger CCCH domain-containing protein 31-like n=1 Tax=Amaranthus tricolor TaxID=29722 RepID=UPI0025833BEE|nr:zinc finger CCCH domain-containing protein 31-like [Amaranthus tricolor]
MDARKRGRGEAGVVNANGGFKKQKKELEIGIGSKSKPCTKFFSTSGCPFGESCHFLHHVPGGYQAVTQMINRPLISKVAPPPPPQALNSSDAGVKTRLCSKFNSAEGCKFGDKCRFAHGEWQLNKPVAPTFDDPRVMGAHPMHGRFPGRIDPPAPTGLAAGFGASATAKISVDANLAGPIIGKNGVNSKQICRQTGVKLSIRDHDTDPTKKNIELEGTFDQIKIASDMVHDLVATLSVNGSFKASGGTPAHGPASNSYKTKLCENFTKGSCTFGDKCHFAHGAAELRKSGN